VDSEAAVYRANLELLPDCPLVPKAIPADKDKLRFLNTLGKSFSILK
jgi:hypothetical protein